MSALWDAIVYEYGRTATPFAEIALRLFLAAGLAGVIGLERELKQRAAGLRTHMLIGLASATFTIAALELFHLLSAMETDTPNADPIRVMEAITAGVAFLAAGAVIRSGTNIKGLTTGAGMWLAGSIGLVAGLGLYGFAVLTALLGLFVLWILRMVERLTTKADDESDSGGGGKG